MKSKNIFPRLQNASEIFPEILRKNARAHPYREARFFFPQNVL